VSCKKEWTSSVLRRRWDQVLDERGTHNNNDEDEEKQNSKSGRRSKVLLYKRVGNKKAKQVDRRSRILDRMG